MVVAASQQDVVLASAGRRFLATTAVALTVGSHHEFVVSQTRPQLVLGLVPPALPPSFAAAKSAGQLGTDAAAWLEPTVELLALAAAQRAATGGGSPGFAAAVAELRAGIPTAAALQALHRGLGHQLEAAVLTLRSADQASQRRAVGLRDTLKAQALRIVDEAAGTDAVRDAARALVLGLDRIEADNATRAAAQLPQWLPLPSAPEHGLVDARWFLLPEPRGDDTEGDAAAGSRPFTIVLLLSLSRLGELRVDVTLRGERLHAAFTVADGEAAARLLPELASLQRSLETDGLVVEGLQARAAARGQLPVADLLSVPESQRPDAMVDVHA